MPNDCNWSWDWTGKVVCSRPNAYGVINTAQDKLRGNCA